MLWIGLHLPWLALEAFVATLGEASAGPVALIEDHQIRAANRAARALGVKPAMKRATALALAPQLVIGQADPVREREALQAVAQAALAFTPSVSVEGEATVLLEVSASLRLFGGLRRLLARLAEALAPLGHRMRLATAPTPLGAALLAAWREDLALGPHTQDAAALGRLLDDAPVWLLGRGRAHWEALQGMGLKQLADLRHLPRSGLARRFGPELIADLDRARGTLPDPRRWVPLARRFDARLELFARADRIEQLQPAALHLLQRLVAWARAWQARVAGFTLRLLHEARLRRASHDEGSPAETMLPIVLGEPSNDAAHLLTLLTERLGRTGLPAPVLELVLEAHELAERPPPNGELFPSRSGEREGLRRLIDRLQARLGRERIQRLQLVEDHRPERATVGVGVAATEPAAAGGRAQPRQPGLPVGRPVWLLPEALPLAERRGEPVFEGRPLKLLAGPERIESGWWDAKLATRDYFVAEAADGTLVWIFRDRLPARAEGGWFLHGRYG